MNDRHCDDVGRVRPLRLAAFGLSVTLTMVAVVATVGLVPDGVAAARAQGPAGSWVPVAQLDDAVERLSEQATADDLADPGRLRPERERLDDNPPPSSGSGRRVVLDLSDQQVWLVREGGSVLSTYAVSASRHDNLRPGRFAVYSRSRTATSFDYTATMRWMVRFTQGATAAIGFHDIPVGSGGEPLQSAAQLGTPTSSGCIRQRPRDARELWRFAPVGTPVVVVA